MQAFQIPKKAHADIIGARGSVINQLQADTGCRIQIPRDDESREVVIEGSVEQIAACKAEMEKVLGWPIGDQALSLAIVQVPGPLKGRIIGSGGSTIKQLEREFMCNIGMPRDRADERVELEGPADKLDALMQAIEERIGQLLSVVQRVDPASDGTAGQLPKSLAPAIDFFRDSAGEVAEALFFEEGENGPEMTRMLNFLRSARKTIDVAVFSLTVCARVGRASGFNSRRMPTARAPFVSRCCRTTPSPRCCSPSTRAASLFASSRMTSSPRARARTSRGSRGQASPCASTARPSTCTTSSPSWTGSASSRAASTVSRRRASAACPRARVPLSDGSGGCSTPALAGTRAAALENEENIMIVNNASLVSQYAAHFEKMWERFGAA